MFVQVIQGQVGDAAALRAALDRWNTDIAPGASGWLGSTGGVTDDGRFVALTRFESADAARRNSDRPEQGQWWAETAKLFTGDATFHDCPDVVTFGDGGSDDAGFVQVIQGRSGNIDRMRQMTEDNSDAMREWRPDVIGGIVALHGDDGFTQAVYFTSEADAREGEKKEPPAEMREMMEEDMALGEPTFFDLKEPWLHSPR